VERQFIRVCFLAKYSCAIVWFEVKFEDSLRLSLDPLAGLAVIRL